MTQYNTLNIKWSNSQLNKSESGIKTRAELTFNLSPNMIEHSSDEANFPLKILLTGTQVSRICKTFRNGVHQLK